MDTFKWGIIGPGKIAHDFGNDLALVASWPQYIQSVLSHDRNSSSAQKFITAFNIPQSFYCLEDFVANRNIDAVYIATPHTLHFEEALACLENKIPVLCEKPITINSDQLINLIKSSNENETFLMEGMWIRFLPSIKQVVHFIEKGIIGNIISIHANMSYLAPHDPDSRYFNPALGGGSLLDLGIYPVFLAVLLLGKPAVIKAVGRLSDEGIDEACSVLFQYKTGQYAVLESSLVTQTDLTAEIAGDKGTIKIIKPWNEKPGAIQVTLYDGTAMEYSCEWPGRGFQYETEEVVRCINNGRIESHLMTHDFSLAVMKVMDEIRRQLQVKYEMYE